MFNNLALIVRKPGISRREFRDHYEQVHAPLAIPFMEGLQRYLRNHVEVALDGVEPRFDVLSQFAFESVEQAALMQGVLESPRGQVILDDEATFMDKPSNSFFAIADPTVVVDGTARAGRFVKVAAAAKAPAGDASDAWHAGFPAHELAPLLEAGPRVLRCETHAVLGGPAGKPYDAVAFVWFEKPGFDATAVARWKPEASASFLLQVEECVSAL